VAIASQQVSRQVSQQVSFDEIGTPLRDVTFVVVDLETTGGSAIDCGITEVGAVKVRGGQVIGEFQTLVNPGEPIPAFIAVLTGITTGMVTDAPRIEPVLFDFLEFSRGCVLVAHNAPFDMSFLKAACQRAGVAWPGFAVVDTARLARRVLTRDEARDCKLSTLARIFHASTTPNHRALADARATVDVLHALLERLGPLGVQTLEELSTFTSMVTAAQRRKRHLAETLPTGPGVYFFLDEHDRVLYVGKSKSLRARVRSYFTSSETRTRMAEMVALAARVDHVECVSQLEADVRELRLIAAHKPRYNRRSRFPERVMYVKLTREAFPRLSLVRQLRDDDCAYLGPFSSRSAATAAMDALHEAIPIRQCRDRIAASPGRTSRTSPCALAGMKRCGAPCVGEQTADSYALLTSAVQAFIGGTNDGLLDSLMTRIARLSDDQRFEDAAMQRDRAASLLRGASRSQKLRALGAIPQLVAGKRLPDGGWEIVVIRYGRLAAIDVMHDPRQWHGFVDALVQTAETVAAQPAGFPASTSEEAERLAGWLDDDAARLIDVDGNWACPVQSAARHGGVMAASGGRSSRHIA
jgi:DNA polymerase III subunit epsilon